MSDALPADRLSKCADLTNALAEAIVHAQIMGRPVPEDQASTLIVAANFLREHRHPWPPMLGLALQRLAQEAGEIAYEPPAGRPVGSMATVLRFP